MRRGVASHGVRTLVSALSFVAAAATLSAASYASAAQSSRDAAHSTQGHVFSVDDTGEAMVPAAENLANRVLAAAEEHSAAALDALTGGGATFNATQNKILAEPGAFAAVVKLLTDTHAGSENCEYEWPGFTTLSFHAETTLDAADARRLGVSDVADYRGVTVRIEACGTPNIDAQGNPVVNWHFGGVESTAPLTPTTTTPPSSVSLKGLGPLVGVYYVSNGNLVIDANGVGYLNAPDTSLQNVSQAASVFHLRLSLKRSSEKVAVATVLSSTTSKIAVGSTFRIVLRYPGVIIQELGSLATEFCNEHEESVGVCGA